MAVKYKETTNYFFLLDENYYVCGQKEIDAAVPNVGWRAESYMPHMSARYRPPYPLQTDISLCECL